MYHKLLPIIEFLGLSAILFTFNFALLKYYTDPLEQIRPVLFIQVTTLTTICLHALLIPLDNQNALYKSQGTFEKSIIQFLLAQHNLQV